jgi:hypothetical protein
VIVVVPVIAVVVGNQDFSSSAMIAGTSSNRSPTIP